MIGSRTDDALSILSLDAGKRAGRAVVDGRGVHTWGEISDRVAALIDSGKLDGFNRRHPCMLETPPVVETVVNVFALLQMRIPMVLVSHKATAVEKAALAKHLSEIEEPLHPDCAVVILTSGTTGSPKPVMLSRRALIASALSCNERLCLTPNDVWLAPLPLNKVGGFSILTRSLIAGSAVAFASHFSARNLVGDIERTGATLASVVPTMLAKVVSEIPEWRYPEKFRLMVVGGAAMTEKLKNSLHERRMAVVTTYGMTETASNVATGMYSERFSLSDGAGVANPGACVSCIDGEIVVSGPMTMLGYWGGRKLGEGGIWHTGDMGAIDANGRIHIFSRKSEMIITGGENVHPQQVELELANIEGIDRALVSGRKDEIWGQVVCALLVFEKGRTIDEESLASRIAERISGGKRPRFYAIADELPVTKAGKPDRSAAAFAGFGLKPLHYGNS